MSDESQYEPGEKRPLDAGAKIRAKVKRGEGTRDQDTLLLEGRGESAAEAAASFEASLQRAEERNWAGRLRELQADDVVRDAEHAAAPKDDNGDPVLDAEVPADA